MRTTSGRTVGKELDGGKRNLRTKLLSLAAEIPAKGLWKNAEKQRCRSGSGRKGGIFFCWNSLLLFSKEKRADDFRQHGCSHRYFYIKENYQEMQERIKCLPSDDEIEGSTNYGKFIEYFSMDDSKWIQIINKALEEWRVFRKRMGYFWFCMAHS